MAPIAGAKRGQCPGLNAAANHGVLDRSGMTTITQGTYQCLYCSKLGNDNDIAIEGLGAAYHMGADLAGFLAILAVGISGDPLTETWSIGTGFTPVDGVTARGIAGTHNKYEGDSSVMRVCLLVSQPQASR
jgi:hypothetical protein